VLCHQQQFRGAILNVPQIEYDYHLPLLVITGNITSSITDYKIITDNADGQLKLLPLLYKKSKGPGGACVRRRGGAPVPRHNGTMASPSLINRPFANIFGTLITVSVPGNCVFFLRCVAYVAHATQHNNKR